MSAEIRVENSQVNSPTTDLSRVIGWVIQAILLASILILMLYRLESYPAPWYDEGSHLHVAKNYALNGIYADYTSDGIRYYGPAVGVGPTVMLPIAFLFRAVEVSIPLARLVIVTYGLLALLMLYLLGRRLGGPRLGWVAVILLVVAPGAEFIFNARTVLGEVPGLFFVVAGLWLWLKPGTLSLGRLIGVGLLMGLASITKNQYALFVLPGLLLAWITDLVWYRQRGWRYFVIPGVIAGIMFAAWTYIMLIALGGGNLSENLATLRTASAGAFFIFGLAEMEKAGRFLTDSAVYGGTFFVALVYGLVLSVRRNDKSQQWGLVGLFILANTALFVSSLAWPRYAFAATALASLFVARLLFDLTDGFRLDWQTLRNAGLSSSVLAARVAGFTLLVLMTALPLFSQVTNVMRQGSDDVYQIASYLDENIPQDSLIETWEQNLSVLTNHNYHYPPQIVLAWSVDEVWRGGQPANELYDFREYVDADYVIVGAFAKYTGIYPLERLEDYDLVHTQGAYDVYQRAS